MNSLRQKLSIQHGIPTKRLIHPFQLEPRHISIIKKYNSTMVKPLEGIRVLELGQVTLYTLREKKCVNDLIFT